MDEAQQTHCAHNSSLWTFGSGVLKMHSLHPPPPHPPHPPPPPPPQKKKKKKKYNENIIALKLLY